MLFRSIVTLIGIIIGVGSAVIVTSSSANALSMKECSAKYKAAKEAGTLGGVKWNEFRKSQCGTDTSDTPAAGKNEGAKPVGKDTGKEKEHVSGAGAVGAKGLTMAECSAKYKAAQEAGVTSGMKWNEFRKAECTAGADPIALSTDGSKEPTIPTTVAPSGVSFPKAISSKYASETPAKARMHTCLEQYHANKESNTLGGLRWVQKGGGYYSLCNAKLKGTP